MKRLITSFALLGICILLSGAPAFCQTLGGTGMVKLAPAERKLGIGAGDFLILPKLNIAYSYDSNVFYAGKDDIGYDAGQHAMVYQQILPGNALTFGLGLGIKNKNTKTMLLDLVATGGYDLYLSDNEKLKEHSNFKVDAGIRAEFFRSGPVALILHERFRRMLERRNGETSANYNRHVNDLGLGIRFAPGGKALQITAGYSFISDAFTDVPSSWGDMFVHDLDLRGAWKFFPYTALVLETNWQIRDYRTDDAGRYGELTDSKPLRIRVGLNGFITKRFSILGLIGYGNSFHKERADETNAGANDSFNMLIGELRLSLQFNPDSVLQGGYRYDFRDSLFVNFTSYHKLYLNYQQRIAKRLELELDVGYFFLKYSALPRAYLENESSVTGLIGISEADWARKDQWLVGSIRGTVDITRWLAFEVMYRLELINDPLNSSQRFGSCLDYACDDVKSGRDYTGYTRHYLLANLIFRY